MPRLELTIGDFVLVRFEEVSYVGKIVEKGEDITVSYLRRSSSVANAFFYPEVEDVHVADLNDVITKLPAPYKSKTARLARYERFPYNFASRDVR